VRTDDTRGFQEVTVQELDKEKKLTEIRTRLKQLLVSSLSLEGVKPEDIKDDAPLFNEGLGLDSLDAVEIVVLLQRNFGLEVKDMEMGRKIFRSVNTLAEYVYENTVARPAATGASS
jgi:acyl carrier protein